jgi:hypothetical protein
VLGLKTKPLLWCLLCGKRFSIADANDGQYFAETGICRSCYQKLQKDRSTCFGKIDVGVPEGRVLGYDEAAIECREFCEDRKICQQFVTISAGVGKSKGVEVSATEENP